MSINTDPNIVRDPPEGDMLKSVYDTDESNKVDDSEKLEASTKAQVQDHTPKSHTHPASGIVNDSAKLEGSSKAQVQDHTPKAHTHSVKFSISIPIDTPESTGTDKGTFAFAPGFAGTIEEVYIMAKVAPGAGKTLTVDINKNGTTIFTAQANRPSLANANTEATSGTPDVVSFAKNDESTIDVDVSTAGTSVADVIVLIRGTQTTS